MAFAIVAECPLGIYRGRVGEGQLDLFPSTARLHAALLAAAGSGPRAVATQGGVLGPCEADRAALVWLERNPPDGIALPRLAPDKRADARSYRDLGLLDPKRAGIRRVAKDDAAAVALDGRIMWVWEQPPPEAELNALEDLCPDVAYIGQSDTPVRVWTQLSDQIAVTHHRNRNAGIAPGRGSDLDIAAPRAGRTEALTEAFVHRWAGKPPSLARDRVTSNESEAPPPVVTTGLGSDRYVLDSIPAKVPWPYCWIVPFTLRDELRDEPGAVISQQDKVAWSVAMHRALVATFDGDAPNLLTGAYDKPIDASASRVVRPANRLALQIVDDSPLLEVTAQFGPSVNDLSGVIARQAFVIAVPDGTDQYDLEAITRAVNAVTRVWLNQPNANRRTIDIVRPPDGRPARFIDASAFWKPPTDGLTRVWSVSPAAVETRRQGARWSLADAVTLSIGLVWRDELTDPQWWGLSGEERYRYLVKRVLDRGVEIVQARPLNQTHADRYVHKVPKDLMPLPYTGLVALGDLEPELTAFVALGQSRHLGGGLLVPCDVPSSVIDSWRLQ